jgi:anti-sigma regulatory factor (Ser/Thr protein kinase)
VTYRDTATRTGPRGHEPGSLAADQQDAGAPSPFAGPLARGVDLPFTISELGLLRRVVRQTAAELLMDTERSEDLALAVNELATNSICHGGGEGTLRLWRDEHALVCEVRDSGHIAEPERRNMRPDTELLTGRGLWLVEQLCDHVQIDSSPQTGSCVRVYMQLPAQA